MPVRYHGEPGDGARAGWEAVRRLEQMRNPGAVVVVVDLPQQVELAPLVDGLPAPRVDDKRKHPAA